MKITEGDVTLEIPSLVFHPLTSPERVAHSTELYERGAREAIKALKAQVNRRREDELMGDVHLDY